MEAVATAAAATINVNDGSDAMSMAVERASIGDWAAARGQ